MARVTVEDCIEKVKNRFELVLMASKRAKDIDRGAQPSVPRDNDKPTIIALREIADETISLEGLREISKKSLLETKEEKETVFTINPDDNLDDFDEDEEDIDEDDEDGDIILDDEDLDALRAIDNALHEDIEPSSDPSDKDI